LILPIEHSAEDCICIDCDPKYYQLQRTLHWISMAEFYTQDPHQVLQEQFFPSQTVVVRTPQEFFDDYIHASTVNYYCEWISNCTGMYWMFRGHPTPQVNQLYEEQLAEFWRGLDYLRSRFEAQRVVRKGLLVELLRIPF